jgi:hypothetical protein
VTRTEINAMLAISFAKSSTSRITDGYVEVIETIEKLVPLSWFITTTFPESKHPEQADRLFKRWLVSANRELYGRRYSNHGDGITFIRAQENQKNGNLHYHALAGSHPNKEGHTLSVLRRMKFVDSWHEETGGIARIYPYDASRGIRQYIMKYVAKEGELDIYLPPSIQSRLN